MTKVCAISDLHGFLPEIPSCDLLLIAGDVCPVYDHNHKFQAKWLDTTFRKWLEGIDAKAIFGTWGNHDLVTHREPHLVPRDLPWTCLIDEMGYYSQPDGPDVRIYGMPWSKEFCGWAWMLEEPELEAKYRAIPDCDILISHNPPYGYGDVCPGKSGSLEHVGSRALLERIKQPFADIELAVFGHIHEGRGQWDYFRHPEEHFLRTQIANVTHVNEKYEPVYPAMEFHLAF